VPQKIAATEALKALGELVTVSHLAGPGEFTHVTSPQHARKGSLVFCSSLADFQMAHQAGVRTFCLSRKLDSEVQSTAKDCDLLFVSNVTLALSKLQNHFFPEKVDLAKEERHPTAVIHPTAEIAKNVKLGPYSVVGARVRVEEDCQIGAHVVIENDAVIGAGSNLESFVFIGQRTVLGKRVRIKPHSTIGSEGYGFAQDKNGHSHRIPQKGRVVLDDDVEVGANCTIDRATLDETHIGQGTKFDNLVHVAHNCRIGKHCLLTGGFMSAGSSTLGDFVMSGGRVSVTDHIEIASRVQIAGTTSISKSITQSGVYGGYPTVPIKDHLKITSSLTHLPRLRKEVSRILKHLGLKDTEEGST
jgi:UDP-3-O-[3-hydroxymyristoyl] glucosamine N-acyltransferase